MIDCSSTALLEASKCLGCLPRGALFSIRTDLLCRWANKPTGCSAPEVDAWVAAMQGGLGVSPTAATQTAVCRFINTLRNAGILPKFHYINPVVYDANTALDGSGGASAMLYPVIHPPGLTPSVLVGGTLALSLDGAISVIADAEVDTLIVPGNVFPDTSSGGINLYVTSLSLIGGGSEIECGASEIDTGYQLLLWTWSTFLPGGPLFVFGSSQSIWVVQNESPGFWSASQTTFTSREMWFATAPNNVSLKASDYVADAGLESPVLIPIGWFCRNTNFPSFGDQSTKRMSFCAIHFGLDQAETDILNHAVTQMRMDFGGGFIV